MSWETDVDVADSKPADEAAVEAAANQLDDVFERIMKPRQGGQTGSTPTDRTQGPAPTDATPPVCASNKTYDTMLDRVLGNIYDPSVFGSAAERNKLRTEFNCRINTDADAMNFARQAYARAGDPYTRVLTEAEKDSLRRSATDNKQITTGIEFGFDKGALIVKDVRPNSPAAQAGLRAGDAIVSVNGMSSPALQPQQVAGQLDETGKNTNHIKVKRGAETLDFQVKATEMESLAVSDQMLPNGIAYIRLKTFMDSDVTAEMRRALERNKDAKGFIIDVRNNTGGLFDPSLKISSLFISEGNLLNSSRRAIPTAGAPASDNPQYIERQYYLTDRGIELRSPDGKTKTAYSATREPDIVNQPVVVLVNGRTASSAEIFAGAMKDTGGATLIGSQTFGKGISQTVFKEAPEWTQITTMRYMTPSGQWLGDASKNKNGLVPQIRVDASPVTSGEDAQLAVARRYLESLVSQRR